MASQAEAGGGGHGGGGGVAAPRVVHAFKLRSSKKKVLYDSSNLFGYKSGIRCPPWDSSPPEASNFGRQNSKISIRGKLGEFAIAQPDLANGTRFEVLMKER